MNMYYFTRYAAVPRLNIKMTCSELVKVVVE